MSTASKTVPEPAAVNDPYRLDPADIAEPPRTLGSILRRIGPGMILCASIVGSGELVATTTLGAQAGYVALWVILLSCFIKPAIQAEMGRYTIATGETALESFNRLPGPRWKVNWLVWGWAAMVATTLFQVGAMFGGVAQVMNQVVPAISTELWVFIFLAITLALLLGGGYERIENIATIKVALFTMLTFLSALLLINIPQYFSWERLAEGLKFHMPPGGLTKAVAVFGITGVGATEFFMYPYWCVEKGYARFAGKADGSPAWKSRAHGWMRVMQVDVFASMIIYTVATVAFYLLGAGVLNGMGLVPAAAQMIPVLSNMYTKTLGPWALYVFYVGAIATLYGTIFAATAAHSRLYADMFRLMGFFNREDAVARDRYRRRFVWFLTLVPVALYMLFREPVSMVFVGGLAQFTMTPFIGIATMYLYYRHLPAGVSRSARRTAALWFSTIVIIVLMTIYVADNFKAW